MATHQGEFGTNRPPPGPHLPLPRFACGFVRAGKSRSKGCGPPAHLEYGGSHPLPTSPNSTPFRATLVFRGHPWLRDRERTWRLNSSTDWKEGRKEGSQDEKEEEGRQAGRNWLLDPGLAPASARLARPTLSRIWTSAQSLPGAARGTCPSPGREQTLPPRARSPKTASPPASAPHPEVARTPFIRPAASLPPNPPQVNPSR